jgi:hypothetical protein
MLLDRSLRKFRPLARGFKILTWQVLVSFCEEFTRHDTVVDLKFCKLLGWICLWQIRILVRIVVRSRLGTFLQKCREVVFFSKIWHVTVGATWTNQVMTRVNFCHVACHVGLNSTSTNERLTRVICPRGSPTHSRRTFPGWCGNPPTHPPPTTYPGHPPTTHHLPGCFGKF